MCGHACRIHGRTRLGSSRCLSCDADPEAGFEFFVLRKAGFTKCLTDVKTSFEDTYKSRPDRCCVPSCDASYSVHSNGDMEISSLQALIPV